MGEDCMTLTVVRPARSELRQLNRAERSGLPVLVPSDLGVIRNSDLGLRRQRFAHEVAAN